MSSLCRAALPAKMSAFNSCTLQNAVLPQASLQKSLDLQKKFTRFEKKSLDVKFLRRTLQFCLN